MKKPSIFYGWWIVAAQLFRTMLTGPLQVYAFGLFAVALFDEFGWSRAEVYLAHTIITVVVGISGPFIGRWVDRHGIQPLMSIGAFVGGVCFAVLALTQSLWYFYGIYALMAIAQACSGLVPFNTMITNWFEKRRGTVLGILSTGISWGGILITPLVALAIVNLGWRGTYATFGIARVLLIVPLVAFLFRFKPQQMGLLPDGRAPEEESPAKGEPSTNQTRIQAEPGWTLRTAVRQPAFWLLFVTFMAFRFSLNSVLYHAIPFFTDSGIPTEIAATMMSAIAFGAVVGKLTGGFVADRIGPKPVAVFAYALQAITVVIAIIANAMPIYWLFAGLFGFSLGAATPMMVMLVAYCFGRQSFGTIYGTLMLAFQIGLGIGPLVSGYLFDVTGSYNIPFMLAIGFLVTACITVSLAKAPQPRPSAIAN